MTEAEWLACTAPDKMLAFLRGARMASDRKLRLFACACCRRVLALEQRLAPHLRQLLYQPFDAEGYEAELNLFRQAVTLGEQIANGESSRDECKTMRTQFGRHPVAGCPGGYDLCAAAKPDRAPIALFEFIALAAHIAIQDSVNAEGAAEYGSLAAAAAYFMEAGPEEAARRLEDNRARLGDPRAAFETAFWYQVSDGNGNLRWVVDVEVEEANGYAVLAALAEAQTSYSWLIRELFGNPFRPRSSALPSGMTWDSSTIAGLAASAYDERSLPVGTLDGVHLSILADAAKEAGCTDDALLGHLRGPGPHFRGCWALDLILGKE